MESYHSYLTLKNGFATKTRSTHQNVSTVSWAKLIHQAAADLSWHGAVCIEAWEPCYFPSRHLIRVPMAFHNWTDYWSRNFLNTDIHFTDIYKKKDNIIPGFEKLLPSWILVQWRNWSMQGWSSASHGSITPCLWRLGFCQLKYATGLLDSIIFLMCQDDFSCLMTHVFNRNYNA